MGKKKKSDDNPLLKWDSGDVTDALASKLNQVIKFTHLPTGEMVSFKAFLTTFDDDYESKWNKTTVYGRMDPIMTFQGTERTITIGWDVVAYSAYEAYRNMQRVSLLLQMLYPVYENSGAGTADILTAAPLFKMHFMNLANEFTTDAALGTGLVGTVSGFTYSPVIEAGFYNADDGSIAKKKRGGKIERKEARRIRQDFEAGAILPQAINLSCTYTVLHTQPLGWTDRGAANAAFPYGARFQKQTTGARAEAAAKGGPSVPDANAAEILKDKKGR